MSRSKMMSPGQKAWETQRERYTDEEISDRQREAAFKAWETRRKNARSTAAHKAWETRRSAALWA